MFSLHMQRSFKHLRKREKDIPMIIQTFGVEVVLATSSVVPASWYSIEAVSTASLLMETDVESNELDSGSSEDCGCCGVVLLGRLVVVVFDCSPTKLSFIPLTMKRQTDFHIIFSGLGKN